ncbi:MAG: tRNA dihydrouridine synthase DusB, partial [Proteobacteria bacterium]|nr:tRNA dihydrouridine synthase DusB [Pseudomonadota bacterium]
MMVGPVAIACPVVLAPMTGVSDLPFRRLVRRFGSGLNVTEMIASPAAIRETRQSLQKAMWDPAEDPVSMQLVGCEPAQMAEAARLVEDKGAAIIDINMGCPAKKVCNVLAGSALMRDPLLVGRIVAAVVAAVDVPVTLKIRTGWDAQHKNAPQIARIAEDAGIAALAVHGRTRDQHYTGVAEYATIAQIKTLLKIPVIANGDIDSPHKAACVLKATDADAVMVGRAAQGRPWLLGQIGHFLKSGEVLPDPAIPAVRDLLLEHLHALHAHYGEDMGVRIARK